MTVAVKAAPLPLWRLAVPSENGCLADTFQPGKTAANTAQSTSGTLLVCRVRVPLPISPGGMAMLVRSPASGATAPSSIFFAVFDIAGNRLGVSGDVGAQLLIKGVALAALTEDQPDALSNLKGQYWLATLFGVVGTTPAAFANRGTKNGVNAGLVDSSGNTLSGVLPRSFAVQSVGSVMPTSIATYLTGGQKSAANYWMALTTTGTAGGGGGGGGVDPGDPELLVWTPDYTTAQATSDLVQTGQPSGVTGFVSGQRVRTIQPPFIRGRKATETMSIVTGTDVPGSGSDPYRPGANSEANNGALKIDLPPHIDPDVPAVSVTAAQNQTTADTTMVVSAADAAKLSFVDQGDMMTNQTAYLNGVAVASGTTGAKSEHVLVTAPIPDPVGGLVTLTIERGMEGSPQPITTGDVFNIDTGAINSIGKGRTSRCEYFDRFPAGGSSTNPFNWPDPVGSIRWYGWSVFLPADLQISSGDYSAGGATNWLDVTQWKGQFGGSPPRALGLNVNGDGTARWAIYDDGNQIYDLGAVTLGQWTRWAIGYLWSPASTMGWTHIYKNGVEVLAKTAGATMDSVSDNDIVFTGTIDSGNLNQITVVAPTVGDTITASSGPTLPGGTTITAFNAGQGLVTLSAPASKTSDHGTFVTGSGVQFTGAIGASNLSHITIAPLQQGVVIKGTGPGLPSSGVVTTAQPSTGVFTLSASATGAVTNGNYATVYPDPIYFKQGIYESTGWLVGHIIHHGPIKIGEALADVWDA